MTNSSESKWHFSAQTIVGIITVGGLLVAWGATLSGLQTDTERNSRAIEQLVIRLEQNDSATAQLELRMKTVEAIAADAAHLRREMDTTMAQIKADLAVIKASLARLEKPQP